MALGKPVLTYLHDEAVRRTEEAFGVRVPLVPTTKETLREELRPLVESRGRAPAHRRREPRLRRAGARPARKAERLLDLYGACREPRRTYAEAT